MVKKPTPDSRAILRILREHQVDFIVVGGVCAVLQGAPINTYDLDVVHSREPGNLERLAKALEALEAHYRTPGGENLRPDHSHLSSPGDQLLMTRWGPLDLLGVIGAGHGYDELVREAVELTLGGNLAVRVLDLPALIRVKGETAQEKDMVVLAVLRRALEEKEKRP